MSPDQLAIVLGLTSAITLATVNFLVKASRDVLMVRVALSVTSALIMLPFAFIVPFPNKEVWGAFLISVPIHMFYQFALIRAMHRGDLSLVFPVMRGTSPLLVGIFAFLVLGESLSLLSWVGLIISVMAVISFAFLRGQKTGMSSRLSAEALFWAAMTSLGVMAYTVADARGIRLAENAFSYIVWLFILDSFGVTIGAFIARKKSYWSDLKPVMRNGAIASVLSVTSFGTVLYGFTLAEAARMTALRETAVIFAGLMGWLLLKEGMGPRRIIASIILVGGLILMELGASA